METPFGSLMTEADFHATRRLIEARGWAVREARHLPDFWDCWSIVFAVGETAYRLFWDGKERWISLCRLRPRPKSFWFRRRDDE